MCYIIKRKNGSLFIQRHSRQSFTLQRILLDESANMLKYLFPVHTVQIQLNQ